MKETYRYIKQRGDFLKLTGVSENHLRYLSDMNTFREFFQPIFGMFGAMLDVWFVVLPFVFFFLFKLLWMKYARRKYIGTLSWMLLEIIPPRELEKSPKLMESIFAGLAGVIKNANPIEIYVQGFLPDYFSLELVGTEGIVHFYIRTQTKYRNLLEAHFYAQYPDVEIIEVPDYIANVPVTIPNKDWDLWGTEFEFVKPDAYPIRTYTNFEEDVTGKMIDPLAGLTEVMAQTGPGQHLWLQYLICPRGQEGAWVKEYGMTVVNKIIGKAPEEAIGILRRMGHDFFEVGSNLHKGLLAQEIEFTGLEAEKKELGPVEFRLTPGEKDVLKAVQANIGKQQFQTRMRFLYIGRKEGFDRSLISAFIGGIKQFNDMNLNSLKPNDKTKTTANFLFAHDRLRFRQRVIHTHYRDRDWDSASDPFFLSSEELATLYHLPDMAVTTPTMTRVAAKRGGAPANLPVE